MTARKTDRQRNGQKIDGIQTDRQHVAKHYSKIPDFWLSVDLIFSICL